MLRNSASLSPSLGAPTHTPALAKWVIVGASRGIGFEFVKQLLSRGDHVYAVIRDPANASGLWALGNGIPRARCTLLECDIANEASIVVQPGLPTCLSPNLISPSNLHKSWPPEESLTE